MIKVSDKDGKSISLPTCWDDTTTDMYQKYVKLWDRQDRALLFSIQSGYDYDLVRKSRDYELQRIIDKTTLYPFVENIDWDKLPLPTVLKIREKYVTIPKSIEKLTIEQNLIIKSAMTRVTDLRELISFACAVYLQPIYTGGEFDKEEYTALEEVIKKMPIKDIYPIGFFLLRQLTSTGRNGYLDWRQAIQRLTMNAVQLPRWLTLRDSNHILTFH